MKRNKLDSRTTLTYALVVLIGLYLLMLVSPSILGNASLFPAFLFVVSLLPLAVIAWLILQVLGRPSKLTLAEGMDGKARRRGRILASIAALAAFGALATSSVSVHTYFFTTAHFAWENISVGCIFVTFAAVMLLNGLQASVYWPFWNKADRAKTDERQKYVRQRVFELAYRTNVLALIAAAMSWGRYTKLNETIGLVVALCFIGMPAVIAAWRSDS